MSTTRTTMLLTATVMFCFLGSYGCQRPDPAVIPVTSSVVELTFDGLMVFHPVGNHYEVGILDAEKTPAPHHEFSISVTPDIGHKIKVDELKLLGNSWVLEVENGGSGVEDPGDKVKDRHQISDVNKNYFDWIIDLDDPEFHGKRLGLKPGKLKPIIQLSKGRLFTKHPSDYPLKRKLKILPDLAFSDFGFIADKIGLRIELRGEEKLVLRVIGEGEKGVAFRLPSDKSYEVAIRNIFSPEMAKAHVKEANEPEHFQYYYELFDNVSLLERFAFKEIKDGQQSINSRQAAGDYSKTGDYEKRCCPYICGQILLRNRPDPLW